MLESSVEKSYKSAVEHLGGLFLKWVCPGRRGAPDRIQLLPVPKKHRAIVAKYLTFIEMKSPGGKAEPHQVRFHLALQAMGYAVDVIDTTK